jgi:hypothetical protein
MSITQQQRDFWEAMFGDGLRVGDRRIAMVGNLWAVIGDGDDDPEPVTYSTQQAAVTACVWQVIRDISLLPHEARAEVRAEQRNQDEGLNMGFVRWIQHDQNSQA